MTTREASHAGSWYSDDPDELSAQLDDWLAAVPAQTRGIGTASASEMVEIPTAGGRAIIAPHAGYSYSGPAAAWAYKAMDWSQTKRVFLLGPSHHYYLSGCALSRCSSYATPLGPLALDTATVAELAATGQFERMSRAGDEAEHSLEMHLPYIRKMLSLHFPADALPPLVPILVGSTTPATERRYGALLAPYLSAPGSVVVVSSDFCHWGTRFRYTRYCPRAGRPLSLRSGDKAPRDPPIHESIKALDKAAIDAVEAGGHEGFVEELEASGNTVCGRHPIGVVMAAVEVLEGEGKLGEKKGERGRFKFVRYERSGLVSNVRDSSVSYCSAVAVW